MKMATAANMSVDGNEFRKAVAELIFEREPLKILETGTFQGMGSTSLLVSALEIVGPCYEMHTIEVNPQYYQNAVMHLSAFPNVCVHNGLSIPKTMLPSAEETQAMIDALKGEDIYVDHAEGERIHLYQQEVNFDGKDDLLKEILSLDFYPDLIMLDSAGHLGFIEFNYVLSLLKGSCVFILDDTKHIKHCQSLQFMKKDKRFNILKESDERFGFCIAEFIFGKVVSK